MLEFGVCRAARLAASCSIPVHQTPFQRTLWRAASDAHAGGDRADARIMMKMVEAIDEGDYELLGQLSLALRPNYRSHIGNLPTRRAEDADAGMA